MNQAPALEQMVKRAKRVLPFERVALVLQGGGALGAYQAGVYQAIEEANIQVDWICGTSIGGINGALLVGNPPEQRLERLREFWETVTEPLLRLPNIPWFTGFSWNGDEQARYWTNRLSAFGTMFHGVPNFFTPRLFPPLSAAAERPDLVSYYDTTPLKATLERLVDFDRISNKPLRFSVAATNVRTGAAVHFDNLKQRLGVEHVMASASLPPGFPPTEIDGEYYWDGAVVSNSPMQFVIDDGLRHTTLIFQVDLWDSRGEVPLDIPSANLRGLEIHSASHLNITLQQYRKTQKFRHAVAKLLAGLPACDRDDPELQFLTEEAQVNVATVVKLKYQARGYETAGKTFEFSRTAMEEHWQAGYDDTRRAFDEPGAFDLPDVSEAVRIFDVHRGWIK
jgi:NTE family protein